MSPPGARCARCGLPVEIYRHDYLEGAHERPRRRWSVLAALYYRGDDNYCSPLCSTAAYAPSVCLRGS
jgi:hypothetical protein